MQAIDSFRHAIAIDPDYALAYARLAIAQQWFNDWEADADERKIAGAQARANARRAVQLAPQSAVALAQGNCVTCRPQTVELRTGMR